MLHTEMIVLVILFIICTIIVIFYSNKSIKKFTQSMNKDNDNYKNDLKQQNDALLKQLIAQLSDNNGKNIVTEKNLMNIFIKLGESIKESCIESMNQIGACRIAIYLFHNGVRSTHGINFFKVSCICEKVSIGSGVRERMMEHTNIPINLFDEMITTLISNNRYIIINDEKTKETNNKIFISSDKIKYTQLVTIYDINNNILGFVSVEMDRDFSKDNADMEKEVLDKLVKQLTPVLSYSDYISIKTQ